MKIAGILWDYDGTIVDSARKNMSVTIDVLRYFDEKIDEHLPEALQSYEKYQEANYRYKNWKDMYAACCGFAPDEIEAAGKLWSPCQKKNTVIPDMFEGLPEVFKRLSGVKMGICSQNSSDSIRDVLTHYGALDYFGYIVGHDDVPFDRQKPDPEGFLTCLKGLDLRGDEGLLLYIGDHSEDVVFGKNAGSRLNGEGINAEVRAVTVGSYAGSREDWRLQPDYTAGNASELLAVFESILKKS